MVLGKFFFVFMRNWIFVIFGIFWLEIIIVIFFWVFKIFIVILVFFVLKILNWCWKVWYNKFKLLGLLLIIIKLSFLDIVNFLVICI